jgi:hypothetical protein
MAAAAILPWVIMGSMAASTAMTAYSTFKGPPKAPVQEPVKASTESAYAAAQNLRNRKGASSTILTGPLGVTTPPQITKATLGG